MVVPSTPSEATLHLPEPRALQVLAISKEVFGNATIVPSGENGSLTVKAVLKSDSDPSERVDRIARWLRELRNVSPELAEGAVQLDLEFE